MADRFFKVGNKKMKFHLCADTSNGNAINAAKQIRAKNKFTRIVRHNDYAEIFCLKKPYGAVLRAYTVGEPRPKRKRRKGGKMSKSHNMRTAYAMCKQRRKGKRGDRRCKSLFYANCLTLKGTTKKSKKCHKVARSKLSR